MRNSRNELFNNRNLFGSSPYVSLNLSSVAFEEYSGSDVKIYMQPWNGLFSITLDRNVLQSDLSEDDVNDFFEMGAELAKRFSGECGYDDDGLPF